MHLCFIEIQVVNLREEDTGNLQIKGYGNIIYTPL